MSSQFPIISDVNAARKQLWENEYPREKDVSVAKRVGSWLGHKAVSAISIPANLAGAGVGAAGMVATACTIGAVKVAVFALTLGHVKIKQPTGFLWCAEKTFSHLGEAFITAGEIVYDAGWLAGKAVEKTYQGAKWLVETLKIGHIVKPIFDTICEYTGKALEFVANRLVNGFDQAAKDEPHVSVFSKFRSIPGVEELNKFTDRFSVFDGDMKNYHLGHTLAHMGLSAATIPVNAASAFALTALSVASSAAFVFKGLFTAVTGVRVPVPTGAPTIAKFAGVSILRTGRSVGELVADGGVALYQVADALKVTDAVATIGRVALYALEACFGS